jgi:hypothetical protein
VELARALDAGGVDEVDAVDAAVAAALALRAQVEGRRTGDHDVVGGGVAVAALADLERLVAGDRRDVRAVRDQRRERALDGAVAAAAAAATSAAAPTSAPTAASATAATSAAVAASGRIAVVEREAMHLVIRRPEHRGHVARVRDGGAAAHVVGLRRAVDLDAVDPHSGGVLGRAGDARHGGGKASSAEYHEFLHSH